MNFNAKFCLKLGGSFCKGLNHDHLALRKALSNQAAQNGAGHVAAANECNALAHEYLSFWVCIEGHPAWRQRMSLIIYSTVWRTACSQRAISSWARWVSSVGKKRRSARHRLASSSVLL